MVLKGKVKSGFKEGSFWVKKIEKCFFKREQIKLILGTLNIELQQDFNIDNPDYIIEKEEYGGTQNLYIKRCKVLNVNAFIVRTEKNSTKKGDHPLNIIEILSDVNFRKIYNLKDDDTIEVLI